jgi:pyridoxal phosphate enzyme (YggS family)
MAAAATAAIRDPASITLVAVTKTVPVEAIREAHGYGQAHFGESYVQEALPKIAALAGEGLRWHYIGPLQSNKTRDVAAHFDWVHTVERLKIAERLSAQRPEGAAPLQICVQVNVSGEASKSGCTPAEVPDLCRAVAALPRLKLRGLMTIPAPTDDPALARAPFGVLRRLLDDLQMAGLAVDTLSMGMSDDLEAAIVEGTTLVRVGTAIFGERS